VTILNQMLKVLGLSNASQYVVFGAAIILGMVISGDRIADVVGRLLLRPGVQALVTEPTRPPSSSPPDRPDTERAPVGATPTAGGG
jgi:hypothetical protein